MPPALVAMVADRFKALGEPARLALLQVLTRGEASVTDLVEETGLGQANVSKHLAQLHAAGFIERRKDGLFVYYRLADDEVFALCDLMCGRVQAELEARSRLVARR
jgi:ArsR family transcriptional regulator